MTLRFTKMSGAGNDFVVVEARPGLNGPALARRLCPRRVSVGADGLLVLARTGARAAPRMVYYNADGSRAFCANGSRCAAMWMHRRGWAGRSVSFLSDHGLLSAAIVDAKRVRLRMPPATAPAAKTVGRWKGFFLDTGVPHFVVPARNLDKLDVEAEGRRLRRHRAFAPAGTNVDFVEKSRVRTYERGVEAETLACGTGVVAAALSLKSVRPELVEGPISASTSSARAVSLKVASGDVLKVTWTSLSDIWLEGPAVVVYEGKAE